MKTIALLNYTFVFDPSEAWSSGFRFEADLADFFAAHGYNAELVNTQGNSQSRTFYISKIEEAVPRLDNQPDKTPQQVRTTMKKQFQMRDINYQKGGK